MTIDLITAPDPEPVPEPEPEPLILVTLVCRTEGCMNNGIGITMGIPTDVSYAFCGACGGRITEYSVED